MDAYSMPTKGSIGDSLESRDITERLREDCHVSDQEMCDEAADEIERLRDIISAIGGQLAVSNKYAKDARPRDAVLPTVWEIQNGLIADLVASAQIKKE